jgi:hypothetical protein
MPMSLDGLRAWIREVERKLGARTRVFLVLLAISIGASGAAIYLALEADDNGSGGGASTEEVQSLREQVELEGGGAADTAALEAQIAELRGEVDALQAGQEGGNGGTGSGGGGGTGSTGGGGGESGVGTGAGAIPEKEAKKIPESEAE